MSAPYQKLNDPIAEIKRQLRAAQADYAILKRTHNEQAKHYAAALVNRLENQLADLLAASYEAAQAQGNLGLEPAGKPAKTPGK